MPESEVAPFTLFLEKALGDCAHCVVAHEQVERVNTHVRELFEIYGASSEDHIHGFVVNAALQRPDAPGFSTLRLFKAERTALEKRRELCRRAGGAEDIMSEGKRVGVYCPATEEDYYFERKG